MPALQPHLKQLEQHLAALPEEAMLLSELDGYLAGILVCPDLILPSEWLPPIWGGGDEETAPVFDSADDVQALVGLIMRHYNALSRDLQRGRGRYVPIFEVDPRHDETLWELWMSGFERAMTLRPESWARVLTSDDEDAVAALTGMQELRPVGIHAFHPCLAVIYATDGPLCADGRPMGEDGTALSGQAGRPRT